MSSRNLIRSALLLYLVFPFLFLLYNFRLDHWPEWSEFFWAFKNSFLQAFFSATFSLLLGFWVAMGLVSFADGYRRHYRQIMEVLCLLPNFLPPIFVLLALLNFMDPFPMGVVGITIAHTVMNFGLVAVMIAKLVENKIGTLAELAYVEGATRWHFFRRAFWPLMKQDIFLLGLFVFAVCFGSFSVPLIVGGGKGTTLEVLIYEKIRLSNNWSEAVILALFQSLFIFGVSLLARKGGAHSSERITNLRIIRMFSGIVVLVVLSLFGFMGYLQGIVEGFRQIGAFYEIQSALIWNFFGTLLMGTLSGLFSFGSLLLIAYCWPKAWFERFLSGYVAPSTALCCFAFLILGTNESFWPFVKIPLVFNLLCLGSLYRMGWHGTLHNLENQITIAKTLGAKPPQIFKAVLLPQISKRAALLAGIAAIWTCGDYAVSRILAYRDLTLAMTTETLMSSYRLGLATLLSLSLVLCGVICFFIMTGVGNVFSRKSF